MNHQDFLWCVRLTPFPFAIYLTYAQLLIQCPRLDCKGSLVNRQALLLSLPPRSLPPPPPGPPPPYARGDSLIDIP